MTELRPMPEMTTVVVKDRTPWLHKLLKKFGIRVGIYRYTIAEDVIEHNEYNVGGYCVSDSYPERGPSTIIFHWDLDEAKATGVCFDKGDAWMQQEASVLEYDCASIAGDNAVTGWYVIEGFEVSYHKDYWGEYDSDISHTKFRRATFKDFNDIWYGGRGTLDLQLYAMLRLKMPAWWPEP